MVRFAARFNRDKQTGRFTKNHARGSISDHRRRPVFPCPGGGGTPNNRRHPAPHADARRRLITHSVPHRSGIDPHHHQAARSGTSRAMVLRQRRQIKRLRPIQTSLQSCRQESDIRLNKHTSRIDSKLHNLQPSRRYISPPHVFAAIEAVVFPRQEQRHLPWINLWFVRNASPRINVFEENFDLSLSNPQANHAENIGRFQTKARKLSFFCAFELVCEIQKLVSRREV